MELSFFKFTAEAQGAQRKLFFAFAFERLRFSGASQQQIKNIHSLRPPRLCGEKIIANT